MRKKLLAPMALLCLLGALSAQATQFRIAERGNAFPFTIEFGRIAVADFDGDTHPDVFYNCGFAPNMLFLGDGKGAFDYAPAGSVPITMDESNDHGVIAVDVDKDGDQDLVIAHTDSDEIFVWLNDGKASSRPFRRPSSRASRPAACSRSTSMATRTWTSSSASTTARTHSG